jgi:hypothetical protein
VDPDAAPDHYSLWLCCILRKKFHEKNLKKVEYKNIIEVLSLVFFKNYNVNITPGFGSGSSNSNEHGSGNTERRNYYRMVAEINANKTIGLRFSGL